MSAKLLVIAVTALFLTLLTLGTEHNSLALNDVPTASVAFTDVPTPALQPSSDITDNLDPLDINSGMDYKTDDYILHFKLPAGWERSPDPSPGYYMFQYNASGNRTLHLVFVVGPLQFVYARVTGATDKVTSPRNFMDVLKWHFIGSPFTLGEIKPSKIGETEAYSIAGVGDILAQGEGTKAQFEARVATLENNVSIYTIISANNVSWERTEALFDNILDALIIDKVMIQTPISTIVSLNLTGTAVRAQINTLQPTLIYPTSTPLGTKPVPSPTIHPQFLDVDDGAISSFDDIGISVKVPLGWKQLDDPLYFSHFFLFSGDNGAFIQIFINRGTSPTLYKNLLAPSEDIHSSLDLVNAMKDSLVQRSSYKFESTKSEKFGGLSIFSFDAEGLIASYGGEQFVLGNTSIGAADLGDSTMLFVVLTSANIAWTDVKTVYADILKNVKINWYRTAPISTVTP